MKAIELRDSEGYICTIMIDKIVMLLSIGDKTSIRLTESHYVITNTPYQEVKDMIAACYGGEEEED